MRRGATFCSGMVAACGLFEVVGQADPRLVLSALAVALVLLFFGR